jgi:hypothetical protein
VLLGYGMDQGVELFGCQGPGVAGDDLGELGVVAGVTTMSWSWTARLKTECSMVWYLRIGQLCCVVRSQATLRRDLGPVLVRWRV